MTASFVDPAGEIRSGHPAAAPLVRLVASAGDDAARLIAALGAQGVAPVAAAGIVARLAPAASTSAAWREALAESRAKGERLERAAQAASAALAGLGGVALPGASLGPAWSSDVDVLVRADALDAAAAALTAAGMLVLNPLLRRLGRETAGVRRFAAVSGDEVLGSVELCLRLYDDGPSAGRALDRAVAGPPGGVPRLAPADRALRRCGKIAGRRRVTVRDALELAALREAGELPRAWVARVAVRRCGALAGRRHPADYSVVWVRARLRGVRREARRALRPNRLLVAFTGIDGSGKSTQAERLTGSLRRVSIPAGSSWARIGFSGSPLVTRVAHLGQRLLPAGSHSAQRSRATGASAAAGSAPLTRRGPLGWSWALAVTLDYLRLARRAARGPRGTVIVFDRALPDALVDLEQGFGGALDLRVQRRLIERLAPRPDLVVHLRLSGAAAYARKADLFAPAVLERYAQHYDAVVRTLGAAVTLDAERPPDELAHSALALVAERLPAT